MNMLDQKAAAEKRDVLVGFFRERGEENEYLWIKPSGMGSVQSKCVLHL